LLKQKCNYPNLLLGNNMTSEYEHLSYDQQIEAKLTTSLSTESAIEWLKANASKKGSSMLSSNTNNLKDFVNSSYVKRDDPNLSLAVARYGTHIETLKKLYQSDDPVIKMAILANSSIGPEGFLQDGIIEKSEAIKLILDPEVNSDFIKALFSNPHIDREFLTEVVEKENEFKDIDDNTFTLIIWTIISNPILLEKYDDTIMDGYAEYSFDKLLFSLFSLVSTVPVNKNWAAILQPLLFKITLPYVSDDISLNVIDRWFNPETEDDKGELSDMEKDTFFFLRTEIAKVFLKSHGNHREKISPNHQDKAIRLAYYENTKPTEFFDWGIANKDFEYPSFESLDECDLNETQEKVVSTCKKYFELDKEDFVDSLIDNLSFWKRKQERELLRDLSWNLPTKDSYMDHPNHYRAQESYLLSKHPHFFYDDEFANLPEKILQNNKIEKINEKLEQIYSRQEIPFKEIQDEQRNQIKKILDETNQQLEDVSRDLKSQIKEISDKSIITHLIDRIKIIEKKSLSTAWMWLIIFLLILILLTKH